MLAVIRPIINHMREPPDESQIINVLKAETVSARQLMDNAWLNLGNIKRSETRITTEIAKSLLGESGYTQQQLSIMLQSIQEQKTAKHDEYTIYRDRWAGVVDRMNNLIYDMPPFLS